MNLIGDQWLLDLGLKSKEHQGVAAVLLRAQVLTSKKRGHLLDLSEERVRNEIVKHARWGKITKTYVRCLRCGTQAHLAYWVAAADLAPASLAFMLEGEHQDKDRDLDYLRPCRGEDVVIDGLSMMGLLDETGGR